MVEFALVLPILALLLVMAIDFGRVFFGWVALQNAARIGADHAAGNAAAWPPDGPFEQMAYDDYQEVVTADLEAINCEFAPPVPDPEFPAGKEPGDPTIVTLDCAFDLITPLASSILGGPVDMTAIATFPVHQAFNQGLPPPPPPPPEPCVAPVASFTTVPVPNGAGGSRIQGSSPLSVAFTNTTTASADCPITSLEWNFDDGTTSTLDDPVHSFTHSGNGSTTYTVVLTVTNGVGSDTAEIDVRVSS